MTHVPRLVVKNLNKTFIQRPWFFGATKRFVAVNDVSFSLGNEILGFLGANGAGKTTTIQMLLGVLTPTSGTIEYFGRNFAQHRSEILNKVTFASSYVKLPGQLTVWENLDIFGRLYGVSDRERHHRIDSFLKFFDITGLKNKETGSLSAGQGVMVMLAKAFIPRPDIVLLDEPTAALDPDVAQAVRKFVIEQKQEYGLSVLITSHNMNEVTEMCDRVLVLKGGHIIADNTPVELAAGVSKAHVHLTVVQGMEKLIAYAQRHNIAYKQDEKAIELAIDELDIGYVLTAIVQEGVGYSQIYIDRPTLEDYFLNVVKPSSSL